MYSMNYMGDESDLANEIYKTTNDSNSTEIIEENREKVRLFFHGLGNIIRTKFIIKIQVSSDTVEVRLKGKSSRKVSRPVKFADYESLDYSDEDSEPTMKKSKVKIRVRKKLMIFEL